MLGRGGGNNSCHKASCNSARLICPSLPRANFFSGTQQNTSLYTQRSVNPASIIGIFLNVFNTIKKWTKRPIGDHSTLNKHLEWGHAFCKITICSKQMASEVSFKYTPLDIHACLLLCKGNLGVSKADSCLGHQALNADSALPSTRYAAPLPLF